MGFFGSKSESSAHSVRISPISGHKELGLSMFGVTLNQEDSGDVMFNTDESVKYRLMDYEWGGPQYKVVTTSKTTGKNKEKTKRKGRVAGALIGTMLLPGVGTAIGGLHGTGSKTKGKDNSKTAQTEDAVEKFSPATLTLKEVASGKIYRLVFNCNTSIDAQIRCFSFDDSPSIAEAPSASDAIEQIKSLKELLDIGIITQEEFNAKKRQLLGL